MMCRSPYTLPLPEEVAFFVLISAVCLSLGGCAFTAPPYIPKQPNAPSCPKPSLEVVEGNPRGLLLDLALPPTRKGCPRPEEVALVRQGSPDEAPESLLVLTSENPRYASLWGARSSLRFLDQSPQPNNTYILVTKESEVAPQMISEPVVASWGELPTPPTGVTFEALGSHVQVSWDTQGAEEEGERLGVVVFRRSVQSRRYTRLESRASFGEGELVDTVPQPGEIFVYILSRVRWTAQGVALIGPPTAEVYVETMPSGSILPPETPPESDGADEEP